MGLEEQLMIRVNVLDKEAEQSLNILATKKDNLEAELANVIRQLEQIKGMRAVLKQVNDYHNELSAQPDEIRKLKGMK